MNPRRRHFADASLPAVAFALLATAMPAGAQVTRMHPKNQTYRNAETSIRFLRDHGYARKAATLSAKLLRGQIRYDPRQKENGDTNEDKNITLSSRMMGANMRLPTKVFDTDGNLRDTINLARTLFHEEIHVRQSKDEIITSNLSGKAGGPFPHEIEAWSKTILAMTDWLQTALRDYSKGKSTDPVQMQKDIERLRTYVEAVRIYLSSYKDEGYQGDSNVQRWRDLAQLLDRIKTKVDKEHDRIQGPLARRRARQILGWDEDNKDHSMLESTDMANKIARLEELLEPARRNLLKARGRLEDLERTARNARRFIRSGNQELRMQGAGMLPADAALEAARRNLQEEQDKVSQLEATICSAKRMLGKLVGKTVNALKDYHTKRLQWYQNEYNLGGVLADDLPSDLRINDKGQVEMGGNSGAGPIERGNYSRDAEALGRFLTRADSKTSDARTPPAGLPPPGNADGVPVSDDGAELEKFR